MSNSKVAPKVKAGLPRKVKKPLAASKKIARTTSSHAALPSSSQTGQKKNALLPGKSAKARSAGAERLSLKDPVVATRNDVKPAAARAGAPKPTLKSASLGKAKPAMKAMRARRGAKNDDSQTSEIAEAMMGEMRLVGEDSQVRREAARGQKERDLLSRLSISMNRSDEMPNLELAANIVLHLDEDAVSTLVSVIERHDDIHAPDAARVLCEVGTRDQSLLLPHVERLLTLCDENHMEMLPYTMYALAPVAHRHADALWDMRDLFWSALTDLQTQAEMAQAAAVRLLSALCAAGPDYARTLAGGLVDLLGKCMPKDVAFFAESVLPALGTAHSHRAKPVLDRRMKELTPAEVARLRRAVRAAQTGQPYSAAA